LSHNSHVKKEMKIHVRLRKAPLVGSWVGSWSGEKPDKRTNKIGPILHHCFSLHLINESEQIQCKTCFTDNNFIVMLV
jgi:hypothetical protein